MCQSITLTPSSSSPSANTAHDTLKAMRKQAEAYCISSDYIPDSIDDEVVEDYISWRFAMVEWMLDIAKSLSFKQDTLEITTSILDSYVAASPGVMLDSEKYRLSALASLYIAAKLHETSCLSPKHVETLSGNQYTAREVEKQEMIILQAIQWRVHPPTIHAIASELLDVIPMHLKQRKRIMDAVDKKARQILFEEYCIPANACQLAFAAVFHAFGALPKEIQVPKHIRKQLLIAAGLNKYDLLEIANLQDSFVQMDEDSDPTDKSVDAIQLSKHTLSPKTPIRPASRNVVVATAC
eukprot:scaffold1223_cov119-Cylindrotheca_fusiformis.AAC.23